MRLSLHPGVWISSVGLWLGGAVTVAQSQSSEQTLALRIGWIGVALGFLVFVWGIKWDGRHWWDRRWFNERILTPRRGLYVGNILVSDTQLDANHFLDLAIRGYNGTAQTVRYGGCVGSASLQYANTPGGFELQPPIFMHGDAPCRSGEELTLSFHLALTPAQVTSFRAMQAAGVTPQLMFAGLTIWLNRRWGRPLRLPLWDGVSLQGALVGGRIFAVVAQATAVATASLE